MMHFLSARSDLTSMISIHNQRNYRRKKIMIAVFGWGRVIPGLQLCAVPAVTATPVRRM
jgi:hypothetical protein